MLLIKFEMALYSLGESQHLFLVERQPDDLNTDGHSLGVFKIVADELSDRVLPVAFVVPFVLTGHGDRLRTRSHPENVVNVGVSG